MELSFFQFSRTVLHFKRLVYGLLNVCGLMGLELVLMENKESSLRSVGYASDSLTLNVVLNKCTAMHNYNQVTIKTDLQLAAFYHLEISIDV